MSGPCFNGAHCARGMEGVLQAGQSKKFFFKKNTIQERSKPSGQTNLARMRSASLWRQTSTSSHCGESEKQRSFCSCPDFWKFSKEDRSAHTQKMGPPWTSKYVSLINRSTSRQPCPPCCQPHQPLPPLSLCQFQDDHMLYLQAPDLTHCCMLIPRYS